MPKVGTKKATAGAGAKVKMPTKGAKAPEVDEGLTAVLNDNGTDITGSPPSKELQKVTLTKGKKPTKNGSTESDELVTAENGKEDAGTEPEVSSAPKKAGKGKKEKTEKVTADADSVALTNGKKPTKNGSTESDELMTAENGKEEAGTVPEVSTASKKAGKGKKEKTEKNIVSASADIDTTGSPPSKELQKVTLTKGKKPTKNGSTESDELMTAENGKEEAGTVPEVSTASKKAGKRKNEKTEKNTASASADIDTTGSPPSKELQKVTLTKGKKPTKNGSTESDELMTAENGKEEAGTVPEVSTASKKAGKRKNEKTEKATASLSADVYSEEDEKVTQKKRGRKPKGEEPVHKKAESTRSNPTRGCKVVQSYFEPKSDKP